MNDYQICMLIPAITVLLVFGILTVYEFIESAKFSKELKQALKAYEEIRQLLKE